MLKFIGSKEEHGEKKKERKKNKTRRVEAREILGKNVFLFFSIFLSILVRIGRTDFHHRIFRRHTLTDTHRVFWFYDSFRVAAHWSTIHSFNFPIVRHASIGRPYSVLFGVAIDVNLNLQLNWCENFGSQFSQPFILFFVCVCVCVVLSSCNWTSTNNSLVCGKTENQK